MRFCLKNLLTSKTSPDFRADVLKGLSQTPKYLQPLYFYDQQGSLLFEKICRQPEYYLSRKEKEILENNAAAIASFTEENTALVELGSGNSLKTEVLIKALLKKNNRLHYLPVDISSSMLKKGARRLLRRYAKLSITGFLAEYQQGIERITRYQQRSKLILFLGSNLGNFERKEATLFLKRLRMAVGLRDRLLLGLDMQKSPAVLERAYNDARRMTARFNLNLLQRINRELGGQFPVKSFRHHARYNKSKSRIEMHLVSRHRQSILIHSLNRSFTFERGTSIHTETSHKYNARQIRGLAHQTGFKILKRWMDQDGHFSLNLLIPRILSPAGKCL